MPILGGIALGGVDDRGRIAWLAFSGLINYKKSGDKWIISGGFIIMKQLLIIFITVFLAELGDKTQLATLLFATNKEIQPALVFLAAAGALVVATGIAVFLGATAGKYLTMIPLKLIAGLGFIAIGAWSLYGHFSAA